MTSFNYLRSHRLSLSLQTTLCGTAILLLAVFMSLMFVVQRATGPVVRLSSHLHGSLLRTQRPQASVLRKVNRRPFIASAPVHRGNRRNGLLRYPAGEKPHVLKPFVTHKDEHNQRVSSAPPPVAVFHTARRLDASVLAIVTGSRSSALLLLRGKTQIVSVGDSIEGVHVAGISENRVLFSDGQSLTLRGSLK